jgi:hypothetical protein
VLNRVQSGALQCVSCVEHSSFAVEAAVSRLLRDFAIWGDDVDTVIQYLNV